MINAVAQRNYTGAISRRISTDTYINRSDIKYLMLSFMYVFYFKLQRVPILSLLDSTLVLGTILMMPYISYVSYRKEFNKIIGMKRILGLLLSCVILLLLAITITSVHGQFEFSICKPLVHQLLFLIIGFMFYAYLKAKHKHHKVLEYIIVVYAIQSVIQYAAFLIPPVNSFTDLFKTEEIIILKQQYDGFRLNAISGGLAFSLAGAYAIVVTIMLYRWNEIKIKHKFITLCLLLAGSVPAGRTALLLIFVAVVLYVIIDLFTKHKSRWKIKQRTALMIVLSPVFLTVIILLLVCIFNRMSEEFLSKLGTIQYWLVKWKTEYFRVGNESSYDFWATNYGVVENIKNIIFGDGIYTNLDGTYYLRQDAGYVRMLGFGGIVWIVAMFLHQLSFFEFNKRRRIESSILLFLMLVGTLKADCIGIDLQIILVLTLLLQVNVEEAQLI